MTRNGKERVGKHHRISFYTVLQEIQTFNIVLDPNTISTVVGL